MFYLCCLVPLHVCDPGLQDEPLMEAGGFHLVKKVLCWSLRGSVLAEEGGICEAYGLEYTCALVVASHT